MLPSITKRGVIVMKKRIGLDIDGTITDPATFVPYLNKDFNKKFTLADLSEYDLTKILRISDKEFWDWMEINEPTIYAEAELAYGAKQALLNWSKEHELIYITARRKHLTDVTTSWFANRQVPYHHIELVGKHDKLEAVKAQKLDVFLEDKHDNAVMISEEFAIPVLLFDTPYNQMPTPKSVVRVRNWQEAYHWMARWLKSGEASSI